MKSKQQQQKNSDRCCSPASGYRFELMMTTICNRCLGCDENLGWRLFKWTPFFFCTSLLRGADFYWSLETR